MQLRATFDLTHFRRHSQKARMLVQRRLRRVLSKHGKAIAGSVRRRKTVFDRTNTHKGVVPLQRSIWLKQRQSPGEVVQSIGWGVEHGPMQEWGPRRKRKWTIPGPVAWKVGTKQVWANAVERTWSKDQLRPHFRPAVERAEPKFLEDVTRALVVTVEGGR